MRGRFLLLLISVLCASAKSDPTTPTTNRDETQRFHCALDARCPEVLIAGDPHARWPGRDAPFRGYGDPNLAYDEQTNTLWMLYSWLDVLHNEGKPRHKNLGVRTHLAKSSDGGETFRFVRAVNRTERVRHPHDNKPGWLISEVPSFSKQSDGMWQAVWFRYFSPVSETPGVQTGRTDFHFVRSKARTPESLGDVARVHASTQQPRRSFGAEVNLNNVESSSGRKPLANCAALTEPDLFVHEEQVYFAAHCIVISRGRRAPSADRLVLLKQTDTGYEYIANLTDVDDARQFSADVLTQPDLVVSRDGTVLLLATPKRLGADPEHQGCVVFAFADVAAGRLQRERDRRLITRALLTADGNGLGPGLCTYDPHSETGILLVITTVRPNDPLDHRIKNVEFSLRQTGVHP